MLTVRSDLACCRLEGALALATRSAGVGGARAHGWAATDGAYQDVYSVNGCASGAGIFSPASFDAMATAAQLSVRAGHRCS